MKSRLPSFAAVTAYAWYIAALFLIAQFKLVSLVGLGALVFAIRGTRVAWPRLRYLRPFGKAETYHHDGTGSAAFCVLWFPMIQWKFAHSTTFLSDLSVDHSEDNDRDDDADEIEREELPPSLLETRIYGKDHQ